MRAITICQPYASLIANPPHEKRIENRSWETLYRGEIAIHAGKSRSWLDTWDSRRMPRPMPFGAVVAVANLVGCAHLQSALERASKGQNFAGLSDEQFADLFMSEHASGPFCWIFRDIRPLAEPFVISGSQGMWNVPTAAVRKFKFLETVAG